VHVSLNTSDQITVVPLFIDDRQQATVNDAATDELEMVLCLERSPTTYCLSVLLINCQSLSEVCSPAMPTLCSWTVNKRSDTVKP